MDELERLRAENAKLRELVGLAEFDMSGICQLCKNKELYKGTLMSCKHLRERGVIAASEQSNCAYFKWRHADRLKEIDGKDGV